MKFKPTQNKWIRKEAAFGKAAVHTGGNTAQEEFLSNISHELRTPLNIVLGMLALALEDEELPEHHRVNLAMAEESAAGLLVQLNDLISLSYLAAGRLTPEKQEFSPKLLLSGLAGNLQRQVAEKNLVMRLEWGPEGETVLKAGFAFLSRALEKILQNAIKFSPEGAVIRLSAEPKERDGATWLVCQVSDQGPGLGDNMPEPELFTQGDGSSTRKYGGLGLGLKLAQNLIAKLGGTLHLQCGNHPEYGTEVTVSLPVELAAEER